MKSIIKNALLGLALSSCAAFASATVFTNTVLVQPQFDESSTVKLYPFDSYGLTTDPVTGAPVTPLAGDTFTFDYLFNFPDAQTSFAFLVNADQGSVAFSDAAFGPSGSDAIAGFISDFSAGSVSGGGILETGTYDLRLSGAFLADAGGFTGIAVTDIADTSAVPEPMSLSLVGLGLAGMAGLRRRKAA